MQVYVDDLLEERMRLPLRMQEAVPLPLTQASHPQNRTALMGFCGRCLHICIYIHTDTQTYIHINTDIYVYTDRCKSAGRIH